jgi:hypothetical protein
MNHDDELGEVIEQLRRTLPKILFALSRCRITEDNSFRDLLSRSYMRVNKRDEIALVEQQRRR